MRSKIVTPEHLQQLTKLDPRFQTLLDEHGRPPEWERPPGFRTLCRIILEQQVHLNSARKTYELLNERLPDFVPEELLRLSDEELLACKVSRQKRGYLRNVSRAVLKGELDFDLLQTLPEPEVRARLVAIKGIGNWTVDVYAMFCLKHPDIFPMGDVAAVGRAKEMIGTKEREEVARVSTTWSPVRTLATFLLYHAYLRERGRRFEV